MPIQPKGALKAHLATAGGAIPAPASKAYMPADPADSRPAGDSELNDNGKARYGQGFTSPAEITNRLAVRR